MAPMSQQEAEYCPPTSFRDSKAMVRNPKKDTLIKENKTKTKTHILNPTQNRESTPLSFCSNNLRSSALEYLYLITINDLFPVMISLVRLPLRISIPPSPCLAKNIPIFFIMCDQRESKRYREREKEYKRIWRKQFQNFSSTLISKMAHLIHEHL